MDEKQVGRAVLIEFWDFCRVNSIRTLPYLRAWHERYAADGLRVIGVHSAGFPPSEDPEAVRAAVERLAIPYPVVVDVEHEIWGLYDNLGWPARYLWNEQACLFEYHYGEGAYADTERAIQELLGVEREPVAPVRPEDGPDAVLEPQSEDVPGRYSGPYEAAGVWAVLDGTGTVTANGREVEVAHPGCYPLIEHHRHTAGVLELEVGPRVECYAVCFTPGVA
ncbi:MAG TPA: DipZ protein [Solirubrobacteraceae bacterium]|nr:DipZ protein [Solirubrobacteraceae bacterium]